MSLFETLDARGVPRLFAFSDRESGLRAFLVVDDLRLGPAVGGIRTWRYRDEAAALRDVAGLARAMTRKCALAGLDAGGGKGVVLDHADLDRPRAFAALGARIAELGGLFRTAGDLGTTEADLAAMATTCPYVHGDVGTLSEAVGIGVVRSAEAAVRARAGLSVDAPVDLSGLRGAVQGCGAIGGAVARALAAEGMSVVVSDLDAARAAAVARAVGGSVVAPEAILVADVDVVSPCAVGGVVTRGVADALRAWALVPGANGALSGPDAERALVARGVLTVPDAIASAGAVVEGIGRTVMGLEDRTPLLDALGATAYAVITEAGRTGALPTEVATALAERRLAAG